MQPAHDEDDKSWWSGLVFSIKGTGIMLLKPLEQVQANLFDAWNLEDLAEDLKFRAVSHR